MGEETFLKISDDDFYLKQQVFQIWLIKKKKKKFDDLSSSKQKKYFKKFAKKYNKKKLDDLFYNEPKLLQKYGSLIQQQNHNWKMQLNEKDIDQLNECMFNVEQNFTSTDLFKKNEKKRNEIIGPSKSNPDQQYEKEIKKEFEQKQRKYERKQYRKEQEEYLDELVPKKVGKEALLEKKKMLNQKINGSRDDTGINDYKDSDLFGEDSMSSFQRAKLREQQYLEKRQQKKYDYQQQNQSDNQDLLKKQQEKEERAMQMIYQHGKQFSR